MKVRKIQKAVVFVNASFSALFSSHFYREKCLLPLQLALESKNVKLAQHALAGMQVWLGTWVDFDLLGWRVDVENGSSRIL